MMIDIRLPNINALGNPQTQLEQVRRYLYGLAEQLNFALATLEKEAKESVNVINTAKSAPMTEEQAQSNFNSVKSLIIKSADIISAYYDVINQKLAGEYVAQSEFGEYTEKTEQLIETTSAYEKQTFDSIQSIQSALDEIEDQVLRSQGYIKTGELYEDQNGFKVYGVEIGQRNVEDGAEVKRQYARFLGDRLSFYDKNDVEVAYISNYKLYINNAEITESLKIGGYLITTDKGLAFKWVGGT